MSDPEVTPPRAWWTKEMRESGEWFDSWVSETMSVWRFCGCGAPEVVVKNMLAYMETCADKPPDGLDSRQGWGDWYAAYLKRHPIKDSDVFWFCAYLAAKADWTEHGGSVNSAWLEPAGEAWLAEARVNVPKYEAEGWP